MRPLVKRHGGKAYLARRIEALLPHHRVYLEPFVGGGSVLLNKVLADREVACDIDADLIHLWETVRKDAGSIAVMAAGLPYDEGTFRSFLLASDDPIRRALGTLVLGRFSRGGLGKAFAWSERTRGGMPGDVNSWRTFLGELPRIAGRIAGVDFRCGDVHDVIGEFDGSDTLIYADPPYMIETRTVVDTYRHEATPEPASRTGRDRIERRDADRAWHCRLLENLLACRCKVALSGYRSALYDDMLAGWRRVEWDMPNHSGQGKSKQRRVECLWMNYGSQRRVQTSFLD